MTEEEIMKTPETVHIHPDPPYGATDSQRQKLRKLADEILEWDHNVVVTTDDLSLWLHDALRVIAEEDLSDTAKVAADVGNVRDGYTEALLKRLVETGVDPKTLVVKSQMKDGVYKTWVDQQESVSDTYKSPAPQPLNAPPPDDMPCYVWGDRWQRGGHLCFGAFVREWEHWQPAFVPLDAEPGHMFVLWDDGSVTRYPAGNKSKPYGDIVYCYTVPPKEES